MNRLMSRLSSTAALAVIASACQAAVITPPGGSDPTEPGGDAAAMFEREIEPMLIDTCGACHADPEASPATFLAGDYYESVRTYPGLVVPRDPAMSQLVTKGAHRGPAWTAAQAATIAAWIEREAPESGEEPTNPAVTTSAYPVEPGMNRIPLAEVGLPGAELVFEATRISSGMMLRNVTFEAGGTGLSISHPRFVIWEGSVSSMDTDRFTDVELRVDAGMGGLLTEQHILSGFPEVGEVSVQLDSASSL